MADEVIAREIPEHLHEGVIRTAALRHWLDRQEA
jgi:hypothetical protein